jgi:hypothetical protein
MEGKRPLTMGEQVRITITEGDTMEIREKGDRSLIGKIWADKKNNKEAFKTVMSRLWRSVEGIVFKEIQDDVWIFKFSDTEDKQKVMEGRPWAFDRQLLVLNELNGQIPPSEMEFHHTPVWIQIHDMPLHCMTKIVGTKIGELMGTLVEVDAAGDGSGWGRYLRIHVIIDITKPLERG